MSRTLPRRAIGVWDAAWAIISGVKTDSAPIAQRYDRVCPAKVGGAAAAWAVTVVVRLGDHPRGPTRIEGPSWAVLIWVVPSVGELTPTMTLRAARARSRRWDIGRDEPL